MNEQWTKTPPLKWVAAAFNTAFAPEERAEKVVGRIVGQISPCGQFAIDRRYPADDDGPELWVITHLATGCRISPPTTERDLTESDTRQFVEALSPLTDWSAITFDDPRRMMLKAQASEIYHKLFPESTEPGEAPTKPQETK